MRENVIKKKVLKGEPAIGASISFPSPELVEFYGLLGFEWIFIDAEHGPIDWADCQAMARACDAVGISSIVRVPKLDHSLIAKYLETGVLGVGVPHINSAAQAEAVVNAVRYVPEGLRGCDAGTSRSSAYGLVEPARSYFAHSNRELLVAVWVEEMEGIDNLDEILQVPGIDAIHFGPGDLALSMGLPGQPEHADVKVILEKARMKVLKAGKVLIGEPTDLDSAKQMLADGILLLSTQISRMWAANGDAYLRELRGDGWLRCRLTQD